MFQNKRKNKNKVNFFKKIFSSKKKWKKTSKRKFINFFKKKYIWIFSFFLVLTIFLGFYFLLQSTIFAKENKIKEINFSKKSVKQYDNPYLYKKLKNTLSWKNIFFVKYFKKENLLKSIKKDFPLVEYFKIYKNSSNNIAIDILYKQPSLIFDNWKNIFISYKENFYSISTWDQIISGKNSISLPSYTQSINSFSGFFHKISEKKLKFQISKIKEIIWKDNIKSIKYLPWWIKTIVNLKNKVIYFSNNKDISEQLKKYVILKRNYSKFKDIKEIDLGSTKNVIIK